MSIQYQKLILPKPHLSWSQLSMWITNSRRYKREYFDDGKRLDTRYLRFGKGVADMVEELCELMKLYPIKEVAIDELAKKYPLTDGMRSVLMELDIDGISEYEIKCRVREQVPILCFLDQYVPHENAIREYKTGIVEWTKARVQKHDQLLFYAVGLRACGQPTPDYADLYWIETKETEMEKVDFWRDGDKIIEVTGRLKKFHRNIDEREIDRMEEKIVRVAWEISDAYQEFLSEL